MFIKSELNKTHFNISFGNLGYKKIIFKIAKCWKLNIKVFYKLCSRFLECSTAGTLNMIEKFLYKLFCTLSYILKGGEGMSKLLKLLRFTGIRCYLQERIYK